MERRFRNIKTEWDSSKCISHKIFKDPSNGYLVNGKCIFGVDVYVIKNQGIGECMSLLNGTPNLSKHEWKITEFSKLKNEVYYFEELLLMVINEVSMENITNSLPTRYLLKIESFLLLSENGISKYESNEFESGGFNWPYIYILGLLDSVCEVNASFSFLIFDQIHDNFTVMKGMDRRFRNIKTEWGFSKCISHKTFNDPSNGYLVDDKCIFGVDVYVIKNQGIGECDIRQNGKNISVFLESVDAEGFDRQKRVQAKFGISLKNQIGDEHHKKSDNIANWYSAATKGWGWSSFMPCCEFNDPKKGFLIEDCCILEADVSVVGVVNSLT
ncbi:hypothetical protein H5410_019840 [Solanum commersonii]|uniref:MATH domain-containing protein n=1 Tax=Solanum commersonii TaxID=4109 RepID=A0A9J5Z9H5_SOLCO|nr:hypothetical protein H5410_019840 [Solanum commersonii]